MIVYHKYGSSSIGAGFGVSGRIFVAAECGGGVWRRGVWWWSVAAECGGGVWRRGVWWLSVVAECGGGVWWRSVVAECGGGVWRRSVVVECGGVGCGGAATQGRQFFMESKYVNNIEDEKIFW